jgi:hypothetical protein
MSTVLSIVIVAACLVASALSGWPVVTWVLARSMGRSDPQDPANALRGGLWIGLLERVAVSAAVLMGQYTILAAVVAIKGLGRFKELSSPENSERFVVGTLASMVWAGLWGVAGHAVLSLLG